MKNNKKWIVIAIVAAVVAALTMAALLALRARKKMKAWYEDDADFDYELDELDEDDVMISGDEDVDAPLEAEEPEE